MCVFLPFMIKQHSNNTGTTALIVPSILMTCLHETLLDTRTQSAKASSYLFQIFKYFLNKVDGDYHRLKIIT